MLLQLATFLLCALFSVVAEENGDGTPLIFNEGVTATFEFNGKHLRIWETQKNEEYFGSITNVSKFYYEPVLVPLPITYNKISVPSYHVPSINFTDIYRITLSLSTSNEEVQDLAYEALKRQKKRIIKRNVKPLPLLRLSLIMSGFDESLNFDDQYCFNHTFEYPGPTVDLTITTDSDEKARGVTELLENGLITYFMVADPQIILKLGQQKHFGMIKGKIDLQKYKLLQQVRVKSQQCSRTEEKLKEKLKVKDQGLKNLQKAIAAKEEELKNLSKKNNDLNKKEKEQECQTENKDMQEKIGQLVEQLKNIEQMYCSTGWTIQCFLKSCYCYQLFAEQKSWEKASQICRRSGSELASIHSKEELVFLSELANTTNLNTWIGLSDPSEEHVFNWSDGTPVDFTAWVGGKPTFAAYHDCVCMGQHSFEWDVFMCTSKRPFICKLKL